MYKEEKKEEIKNSETPKNVKNKEENIENLNDSESVEDSTLIEIEQQASKDTKEKVRYLTPIKINKKEVKFCKFKKNNIKHIDYKDVEFLMKLLNDQGEILPRRYTGTSLKYQRKIATAVKRARQLALLPYVCDMVK